MSIPIPNEFWNFNNTLTGIIDNIILNCPYPDDRFVNNVGGNTSNFWDIFHTGDAHVYGLTSSASFSIPSPDHDNFTVSIWGRQTVAKDNNIFLYLRNIAATERMLMTIDLDSGSYYPIVLIRSPSDSDSVTGLEETINLNEWFNLMLLYENGVGFQLYVNNVPVTYISCTHDIGTFDVLTIGGGPPVTYFPGYIDTCGLWKRLLTTSERNELYNLGVGWSPEYLIRNIDQSNVTINNSSINVKCADIGGVDSVIQHLVNNDELLIDNIQNKFDNRFNDKSYYWNGQKGL